MQQANESDRISSVSVQNANDYPDLYLFRNGDRINSVPGSGVNNNEYKQHSCLKALSGSHSKRVPPDPISNSEVKTLSADDSVGSPHVKVGHRQVIIH